jgi:hypothetical protein
LADGDLENSKGCDEENRMNAMISLQEWTRFLGWCTVLHVGTYLVSVVTVLVMRGVMVRRDANWFGLSSDELMRLGWSWLAAYKLGILLFAMIPWLALKLMA